YALACGDECAELARLCLTQERCQIRPGNKDRLLRRGDDHAFDRTVILDCIELLRERGHGRSVENVRAGIRPIEGEDADASADFTTNHLLLGSRWHAVHFGEALAKIQTHLVDRDLRARSPRSKSTVHCVARLKSRCYNRR